ncbi:MAG TPA: hypothetical protein VGR57_02305 [Ktedonobacterales bacterium]|nr:hypothetical protein [Ktedonobacterales bacterium]
MIRRESTQDADRPHFYSQFWVDIAAGRREIGGPHTATAESAEAEIDDEAPDYLTAPVADELEVEEIAPAPKAPRPAKPKAEPKKQETARPALTSLADLANIDMLMKDSAAMDDDTVPDIEGAGSGSAIVTDFDPSAVATEDETPASEELEFTPDEFDEEDEWGENEGPRRGSKPTKRRRPEPHRDY